MQSDNLNVCYYYSNDLVNLEGKLFSYCDNRKFAIISDKKIANLFSDKINKIFNQETHWVVIEPGENSKDFFVINEITKQLINLKFDRKSLLIALGGGVVGDITGFVASIYMRGIDWINIPTTLLSQVDSAIGGKTGINFHNVKNVIGSFYQPKAVFFDTSFLSSLPDREYKSGIAEILKYAISFDREFFYYLKDNINSILSKDAPILEKIIKKSCEYKLKIVSQDVMEKNSIRALLNFGHTFAHALESITNFDHYLHGEAVAIGMIMAAKLSKFKGYLTAQDVNSIVALIDSFKLPIEPINFEVDNLISFITNDKKNINGNLTFILLKKIGNCFVESNLTLHELTKFLTVNYKKFN